MDKKLYDAIVRAVTQAIDNVGLDGLKRTSMFMSNNKYAEEKIAA